MLANDSVYRHHTSCTSLHSLQRTRCETNGGPSFSEYLCELAPPFEGLNGRSSKIFCQPRSTGRTTPIQQGGCLPRLQRFLPLPSQVLAFLYLVQPISDKTAFSQRAYTHPYILDTCYLRPLCCEDASPMVYNTKAYNLEQNALSYLCPIFDADVSASFAAKARKSGLGVECLL